MDWRLSTTLTRGIYGCCNSSRRAASPIRGDILAHRAYRPPHPLCRLPTEEARSTAVDSVVRCPSACPAIFSATTIFLSTALHHPATTLTATLRSHATIYTVVTLPYRPATKRTATLVCLVMSIMPSTPLSRLVTKGLATRAMTMIATLLTLPSHPVTKMTVIPAKISTARCQQDSRATYPQRAQYRTAPALQGRLPIRQRPMAR